MPLPLRLAILIALVLLASVLITARLNYAKFVQVTESLDNSRYAFLAQDLKLSLEASLNLGLPLQLIQSGQEIVERQRARYPEILSITVFDEAGHVLYNSSRAHPELLARLVREPNVSDQIQGERIAATTLVNPFGAVVGGVEIRVSAQSAERRNELMLASLGNTVLSVAVIGTLAVALIAAVLLRGVRRRLQVQAHAIAAIGDGGALPLDASGGAFHQAANRALGELQDLERLLEKTRQETA